MGEGIFKQMKLLKIGGASMEKELREIKELLVELNENVSKLLKLMSKNFKAKYNPPRDALVKRKGELVYVQGEEKEQTECKSECSIDDICNEFSRYLEEAIDSCREATDDNLLKDEQEILQQRC